ncbi:MAG: WhiB family transcriptional regulator [Pseudonocardiaceae bacterium]
MICIDCLAPDFQVTRQAPACWEVDPEVFFGPADSSEGAPVRSWELRALAVCAGCPVLATCRAAALEFAADEQYGVIGGMTAGQRRAVLRRSRRKHDRAGYLAGGVLLRGRWAG